MPNYLAVSGKTRQNDLDVAFTISINPGGSTRSAGIQSAQQENRQAFLTFGDASWGSIKLGKDLGIYASDAILNDMTLLGVGSAAGMLAGNTTTLGRIGTGFMYADWKAQAAYSSPNFNGFQFTAGVTQAFNSAENDGRGGKEPAFEAKASYAFAADAVTGKVWASGISQKLSGINAVDATVATHGFVGTTYSASTGAQTLGTWGAIAATAGSAGTSATATAFDMGANVNMAGFGLTGYYGEGKGLGTTVQFANGLDAAGTKRDSKDWYTQATYTLPGVGTKLGVSYGESELQGTVADSFSKKTNEMWVVGAYHPLTKHLNLVAEYSEVTGKSNNEAVALSYNTTTGAATLAQAAGQAKGETKTLSLGAILFF